MTLEAECKQHFITGGAGFIGSHLVDNLMTEHNSVTVYDNLSSGRRDHIQQHQDKPGFRFIQANLLEFNTLNVIIGGIHYAKEAID